MDDTNRKSTHSSPAAYRFGLFTLDASAGSLTRNGLRIKLQDQPFQLLSLLLENSGEIVTREEIRQRLWESNTFVDFDKSLGVAVLKVREALGDNAANPRFLETVPRRGFRFIAPVSIDVRQVSSTHASVDAKPAASEALPESPSLVAGLQSSGPPTDRQSPNAQFRRLRFLAVVLCAAAAVAFAIYHFRVGFPRPEPPQPLVSNQPKVRRSVAVLGFRNLAGEPDQNWLSAAFTEMLNTELAANGDLRLVSGEDVSNVKHDLSLPAEDTLAKPTLARLRSSLGADVVVVGS